MANSYTEMLQQSKNNTTDVVSFRKIIKDIQTDNRETLWPDELGWMQFVRDHRTQIKEKAALINVDPNDAQVYTCSMQAYLLKLGKPKSMAWIVVWLNQLESVLHFDETVETLLIPDVEQLVKLRQEYITCRVTYEKAFGTRDL